MTNTSNVIPVLLHILRNGKYVNNTWTPDSTLMDSVDAIDRVDQLTVDDKYVSGTNKTAVLLPQKLNKNINRMLSEELMHDTLHEIDVVSKVSSLYCEQVADTVEEVLLSIRNTSFNGNLYNLMIFNISRKSFADNNIMMWREQLLFRIEGSYLTS